MLLLGAPKLAGARLAADARVQAEQQLEDPGPGTQGQALPEEQGLLCSALQEAWPCRLREPGPASPAPYLCSGWVYGERLRDGETGWFPEDFARSITSRVAVEGNVRRMERLRVETDV